MQLGGKHLCGVGAPHRVASERRRRGRGRGGGVSQGGQRDVAGRFAARRAVLAVKFGRQAVQGAGPHVVRGCWGVWGTGCWGAALGGGAWGEERK